MSPVATSKSIISDDKEPNLASNKTEISNIIFNLSKDEIFTLTGGYKKFQRELKNWKIENRFAPGIFLPKIFKECFAI